MEVNEHEKIFIEIIKSMGGKDFDNNTPAALNEYARSQCEPVNTNCGLIIYAITTPI